MISPLSNLWGDNSIGRGTSIGAFCDIGGVEIGTDCKIQAHVSIPPGWRIGNRVFIGPGARFANDRKPSLKGKFEPCGGIVEDDAVIGIGAIIMPVRIGAGALIGAGAVVTKPVPPGETWVGNPAKRIESPSSSSGPS